MKAYTHWLALYRRTICVLHLVRDVEAKPCCPFLPSGDLKELSFDPPVAPCNLHPNDFITNSSREFAVARYSVVLRTRVANLRCTLFGRFATADDGCD